MSFLFRYDGKANSLVVFDLKTLKTIETVAITGKKPDAIMYDPYTKKVFAFNGASENAIVEEESCINSFS